MVTKPKVLISCGKLNFPDSVSNKLNSVADVTYVSGDFSAELKDAVALVAGMDVVNKDYLNRAPKLGLVARFGVGYDTVDVEACTERRVYVTHTPDVLSAAVADLTWALILGWMRQIHLADPYTRSEWGKRTKALAFGWDVGGKTLGILGLGRIGTEVMRRAIGFDVKMIYYDIVRKKKLEEKYGIKYVSFEQLLLNSDILSVHVPLDKSTKGMIGEKELMKMKPNALLVNTARGPVIDQVALTKALKDGKIAGSALDVFDVEPIPLDEELLRLGNVLVTPHIASATWETRRKMAERCAESVKAFVEGQKPPFVVPEQKEVIFKDSR